MGGAVIPRLAKGAKPLKLRHTKAIAVGVAATDRMAVGSVRFAGEGKVYPDRATAALECPWRRPVDSGQWTVDHGAGPHHVTGVALSQDYDASAFPNAD
nr:uncharacterized protein CTRU02_08972 [Colletotrichum truncatum]KAF6789180.1 hypothetical protein CTRU02_08972 [Colletotrichum truncatum]